MYLCAYINVLALSLLFFRPWDILIGVIDQLLKAMGIWTDDGSVFSIYEEEYECAFPILIYIPLPSRL